MAVKYDYKIVQIPANYTAAQIEAALKGQGQLGWYLSHIQQIGTNYFAVLAKELSQWAMQEQLKLALLVALILGLIIYISIKRQDPF